MPTRMNIRQRTMSNRAGLVQIAWLDWYKMSEEAVNGPITRLVERPQTLKRPTGVAPIER